MAIIAFSQRLHTEELLQHSKSFEAYLDKIKLGSPKETAHKNSNSVITYTEWGPELQSFEKHTQAP